MRDEHKKVWLIFVCIFALLPPLRCMAQSVSASLSGTVTDQTGAVLPDVSLTLTNTATGSEFRFKSDDEGRYSFQNLEPATYELKALLPGFREHLQRGIRLLISQHARIDVGLQVGEVTETLEVVGNASLLNFDTAEQKAGISPEAVGQLPLIVGGRPRSAVAFIRLLPGVTTPPEFTNRVSINGGVPGVERAVIDGVQIVVPSGGSAFDAFPVSPEAVSELKTLSSNYEPQHGSTGSGLINYTTRSGTNEFHGKLYEYHRNTVLNARQFGVPSKPKDIENVFGGSIGGPVKLPIAWSTRNRTYFFLNIERFRVRGGLLRPVLSIPSLKERNGDFTDWVNAQGNLIPIFDPATTRIINDQVIRDQFMGCDGRTPNVVCPNRIQNSLARQWFNFLPEPTSSGPLNNYVADPVIPLGRGATNIYSFRIDEYLGDRDHIYLSTAIAFSA